MNLPSIIELLPGYRASVLRQMCEFHGLALAANRKDDAVEALSDFLPQEAHIKEAVDGLDAASQRMLELVQLAQGEIDRDNLQGLLASEGIVTTTRPKKKYSYGGVEEMAVGRPSANSSTEFADVMARLEMQGLVLGGEPARHLSTVVDFGIAMSYHIPREVWPHLPEPPPIHRSSDATFEEERQGDASTFSRELYVVWSYIWQNQPRLLKSGFLSKRDMRALAEQYPRPLDVGSVSREDELDTLFFQRKLLLSLAMVDEIDGVLVADTAFARELWEQGIAERAREWIEIYRECLWWNEVDRLPKMRWYSPQGKHVDGTILKARRWIIDQVGQQGGEQWSLLLDFMTHLRLLDRSFLIQTRGRSSGYHYYGYNYQDHRYTRYSNTNDWDFNTVASDEEGWAQVEGEFVRQVLQVLHWMGLVDLGLSTKKRVSGFRLTPLGRHVLQDAPAPEEAPQQGGRIVVQPNFHLVAFGPLGERTLLELERFADRLSADRAIEYEITRHSLYRAQRAGMSAEEVIERLQKLTGSALPQNVVRSLREWQEAHERITIHRTVSLVQVADDELMATLRADDGGGLRPLSPEMGVITDAKRFEHALEQQDLAAVRTHDREGRAGLALEEDGSVRFRHRVPDIYLSGRVQQVAEWQEDEGVWRLTRVAVQRGKNHYKLDAEAQIALWKELLVHEPPNWLEERIKAWAGHYGNVKVHRAVLLEFKDKEALMAIRQHKQAARKLKPFRPRGALAQIDADALDELSDLLADYGIDIKE